MQVVHRVVILGALVLLLLSSMSTVVYGQHSGNCTCSQCAGGGATSFSSSSPIGQTVFLDFDSGDDGSIDYTQQIQDDIVVQLETIYSSFGVDFVTSSPVSGEFSTLTFNSGVPGGLAEAIDFLNLDRSDNAVINVDGIGSGTTAAITGLSANIAAHELGHLLGLRHRDAFGPIGSGIFSGVPVTESPIFPGPLDADEFEDHVLSTPAFGANIDRFEDPVWFSERSAIKLSAITQLDIVAETDGENGTIATAQALDLGELLVPNTIVAGDNAGIGDFDVDAISVVGSISSGTDLDLFSFEGVEGDLFNFEVISTALDRIMDSVDTEITILDSNGDELDYFGTPAFNDDEFETTDSIILDLVLEESGTFFVQIGSFGTSTGDYELFFSRFNGAVAVPEPTSIFVVMVVGAIGCSLRRNRRS